MGVGCVGGGGVICHSQCQRHQTLSPSQPRSTIVFSISPTLPNWNNMQVLLTSNFQKRVTVTYFALAWVEIWVNVP